jgi:hypothetical protein
VGGKSAKHERTCYRQSLVRRTGPPHPLARICRLHRELSAQARPRCHQVVTNLCDRGQALQGLLERRRRTVWAKTILGRQRGFEQSLAMVFAIAGELVMEGA